MCGSESQTRIRPIREREMLDSSWVIAIAVSMVALFVAGNAVVFLRARIRRR